MPQDLLSCSRNVCVDVALGDSYPRIVPGLIAREQSNGHYQDQRDNHEYNLHPRIFNSQTARFLHDISSLHHPWMASSSGSWEGEQRIRRKVQIASVPACHTAIYCVVERLQTFPCQRGDSKQKRQVSSDRLLKSPKSLTVGLS
jgi:hypothetical protein